MRLWSKHDIIWNINRFSLIVSDGQFWSFHTGLRDGDEVIEILKLIK